MWSVVEQTALAEAEIEYLEKIKSNLRKISSRKLYGKRKCHYLDYDTLDYSMQ